jgi:uncharacterized membrane protein
MTTTAGSTHSATPDFAETKVPPPAFGSHSFWRHLRTRLLEGLFVVLPIGITFWLLRWLYSFLEQYVIDPVAAFVLFKASLIKGEDQLPPWFEYYIAPLIAIFIVLVILYLCGVFAHTRCRAAIDEFFLKVPIVSQIYDAVRGILQVFERPEGQPAPQRVVLVRFPHAGMQLPAIVTSTCTDLSTGTKLLCVYVPTTPIPTSGYFLIVPEEEATELNWDVQQTLRAIISGGLNVPPNVTYFGPQPTAGATSPTSFSHSSHHPQEGGAKS